MFKRYFKSYSLFFFLWLSLFSTTLWAQGTLPNDFDEWLESSRADWKIPGMAVGIVKDGQVIYAKGFGEKRLGKGEAVDANTIFSIASVSKNITAAALGILVDEGKINWDDKITQHIPWFQMKDPWVTQEMTIRDALTHRVGAGRLLGNRLQFMTNSSRDSLLYYMRFMDLEKPFRSEFVYNNVMYSLVGQIIEYVDGRTWDEFLTERLFQPLGMHSSTTSITQIKSTDNQAYPHQEMNGKVIPIDRRNWDNAGPAGGVNASIHDLNKWMLMQLGTPGNYQGKTIISEAQMNEMHKPQMIRGQSNALDPQATYGFGWTITDYKGKRVITHGGATDGFNTAMYLLPELDLGIIVVGNNFNRLGNAVAYQVMDAFLDGNDKDWSEVYLKGYQKTFDRVMKLRNEIDESRVKKTKPTLGLAAYVGVYHSEAYGKVEVKQVGKDLVMYFWDTDGLEAKLEHWHYDTFRAHWKNPAQREEFMQFHLDKNGKVTALDFEFVLRPMLLQVGAYPSDYTHTERFEKK